MKITGKDAYEAYTKFAEWKSLVSGQPLPKWEDLDTKIQAAWQHVANKLTGLTQKDEGGSRSC